MYVCNSARAHCVLMGDVYVYKVCQQQMRPLERESGFLERSKLLLCMLAGPRSQLSCKSVEAVKDQLV